ncbi:uncharacterized protein [Onthophagus taurus]|uniref:uncharacterized protein n=1 Tax=Onthophagus taurus TaxID=166361 RepID=UPI0039BE758E
MSTPLCTLLVSSTDMMNVPIKTLHVVCKHLFSRYGLKSVTTRGNCVIIALLYTPKNETLKRKFGNLPVQYMRLGVENETEVQMLASVMHKYVFDLSVDGDEQFPQIESHRKNLKRQPPPSLSSSSTTSQKGMVAINLNDVDDDDDDDREKEEEEEQDSTKKRKVTFPDDDDDFQACCNKIVVDEDEQCKMKIFLKNSNSNISYIDLRVIVLVEKDAMDDILNTDAGHIITITDAPGGSIIIATWGEFYYATFVPSQ